MGVKVAVVTGSNKGIGLAIVRSLCSKFDGDVYLTSRNEERGQKAIKELETEGLKAKFHQLDIDDVKSVECLRDDMVSAYGGIDVLVNNAGTAFEKPIDVSFINHVKNAISTNYFSTLQISKILLPHIKPNGRVVNLSSMVALSTLRECSPALQTFFKSDSITEKDLSSKMNEFIAAVQNGNYKEQGWPNSSHLPYGISKIGVTVMSRIHARWLREQGKNNILLNACCPGWVRTDMGGSAALKSPDQGAETPVYLALLPIGATEPNGEYLSDKKVKKWYQ